MSRKDKKNQLLQVYQEKCTGCGRCVARCPRGILNLVDKTKGHYVRIEHPAQCTACGKCVCKCPSGALELRPSDRTQIQEYYDAIYLLFCNLRPGYK